MIIADHDSPNQIVVGIIPDMSMHPSQLIDMAVQHHQAGRLAEAEALYGQVLAANPNHPQALHLMGIIAKANGRDKVAVDLIPGRANKPELSGSPPQSRKHSHRSP